MKVRSADYCGGSGVAGGGGRFHGCKKSMMIRLDMYREEVDAVQQNHAYCMHRIKKKSPLSCTFWGV